jgi:hypothetical protein
MLWQASLGVSRSFDALTRLRPSLWGMLPLYFLSHLPVFPAYPSGGSNATNTDNDYASHEVTQIWLGASASTQSTGSFGHQLHEPLQAL